MMKTFCNNAPEDFTASIFVIIFVIISTAPLYAENSLDEEKSTLIEDSIKNYVTKLVSCQHNNIGF